ncbi:hypothetical protein B566_EDAN011012 [Ephemera danica]|nr:hypothetical protein B566_EDAN011012 [Ephemera danica]
MPCNMAAERINTIQRHLLPCSDPQRKLQLQGTSGSLMSTELGSSQFQYTMDDTLLSLEQREFYEKNGYLVISKLVEDSLLDECSERFKALCEGRAERGYITMMKDLSLMKKGATGEYLYNKLQDIAFDDVLSKYILHDRDLHYFPFRPANRIVASWTAMEPVTLDNGCLFVLPGSHRNGVLYQHDYPKWEGGVNAFYHGVQGFDDYPKKAISCHYAASECEYIDVKGTTQENIALEIEEIMKKRGLEGSKFIDAWIYRSRLARGEKIHL